VVVTNEISINGLKSYYLMADTLLVTSEHEGFCVPLVEAMALRIPIVACASSAVPEVVGDAGIVLYGRGPHHIADSLQTANSMRERLLNNGWRNYQDRFTTERIEQTCLTALGL
jgi:glycosyltransferase involved in cell wall biosynthesis